MKISSTADAQAVAKTIVDNLNSTEHRLLTAMNDKNNAKNEAAIEKSKLEYQHAQRMLALFSEVTKNAHEMMMSLIRNLRMG